MLRQYACCLCDVRDVIPSIVTYPDSTTARKQMDNYSCFAGIKICNNFKCIFTVTLRYYSFQYGRREGGSYINVHARTCAMVVSERLEENKQRKICLCECILKISQSAFVAVVIA